MKEANAPKSPNMKNTVVAPFLSLAFFFFAVRKLAIAATITFTNNCSYTVWPGILTDDQKTQLLTTGFELAIRASKSVSVPSPWRGRIWARTGCSNDFGIFVCVTGDCGSGQVGCNGADANPPATFAELIIASNGGQDLYNVSNLNGFNLPMSIAPKGGNGSCKSSSCPENIISYCPEELQVRWSDGNVIACKSACLAFNQPRYCCTGDFNGRDKCLPTSYSQFFQQHCPDAFSYAYDDTRLSRNFTCSGRPDYIITFCPYKPEPAAQGAQITFTNKCTYTVWPATLTAGQMPQLSTTGFLLAPGTSNSVDVPSPWSGRFWARTGCSSHSGKFSCATGDCGSGQVGCNGAGANPPATLAELTVASNGGQDFYDISNVDGFNVPMSMAPEGGNGYCKPTSCPANINSVCPSALQLISSDGNVVACKSACSAFNQPQFCCTGAYNTPDTCPPSNYSLIFEQQCPNAYSYAYDDRSSTFTCSSGPNYAITFCP